MLHRPVHEYVAIKNLLCLKLAEFCFLPMDTDQFHTHT